MIKSFLMTLLCAVLALTAVPAAAGEIGVSPAVDIALYTLDSDNKATLSGEVQVSVPAAELDTGQRQHANPGAVASHTTAVSVSRLLALNRSRRVEGERQRPNAQDSS